LLLMAAPACDEEVEASTDSTVRESAPSDDDLGSVCSDLGDKRVCWRDERPVIVPRELPDGPAPPNGWRCGGRGRARVCEDRNRNASAFVCGTQRCLQARPRMPDDGEWECVEISGVVFCHSRGDMAGVEAGPLDLGWLCGPRRGSTTGERVCSDLDADRPRLGASPRCRYEPQFGAFQRSCTTAETPVVGDGCSPGIGCPDGSRCHAGVCLPARPEPACWLDGDCGTGARCVFGSCAGAG
jgi:hypothetical protein